MEKPFSQACENNKQPMLEILTSAFCGVTRVLEIGSGSGQHIIWFAEHLPRLHWQPTEMSENLQGIRLWLKTVQLQNIAEPLRLSVESLPWSVPQLDAIFSANTLHIMAKRQVRCFFKGVKQILPVGGCVCVYGPFNYAGEYSSESNARFDLWLKRQNSHSGIRDFEWVNELASEAGLSLVADHDMPANNRLLEWVRRG